MRFFLPERHQRIWKFIVVSLAAALLLLTGCSDFIDQDQTHRQAELSVALDPDHPVGQTFVARHGGLGGMDVWLAPEEAAQGELSLHLRPEPQAGVDLVTATLSLEQVTEPGFYRFSFPAFRDSHSRYYYAFLEMSGEGQVLVGGGPGDVYLDGALHRNHEALDAQMTFRLAYDPGLMALELFGAALKGAGLLAVAGLLYVVPGWALLAWLWPEWLSWAEKLALAAGLSLALYPLLLLWTDLIGLHLGPLYAWLPVLGGIAALIWRYRDWRPREGWNALQSWASSEAFWPDMTLLIILGFVFGVRLLVVRSLDAPMWGDSYQHTMIAQLLVDNEGLFDSWEPYAELQSLTYHFGFHAAMAVLHWLIRMSMAKAVLWGSQILNGLAVLALYPLAVRIGEQGFASSDRVEGRWGGAGTVLVAGLLSPMPMTYVNWGRYTQLAGQAILPAAVLISWYVLEAPKRNWSGIALSWLIIGGLALSHYRVLIFYVAFVLAWGVVHLWHYKHKALSRVAQIGVGGTMLFLPWFTHIIGGGIFASLSHQMAAAASRVSDFIQQYNAVGDLTRYMGPALWLLLPVATVIGLWHQRRGVLLMVIWWFLLFIAANPRLLRLPGSGAISNFALFIAIYIPSGILIGYAGSVVMSQLRTWRLSNFLVSLFLVGIGLGGVQARMGDVHVAAHAMVTRPDLRAMIWIQEHTSEDAKFLVNSFLAHGGSVIVGSDGGWWLPLLARRANTVPPLNYGTEQGPHPKYRGWVNKVTKQIQGAGLEDSETLTLLEEYGVTHVYVGQQQGRVNYGGPHTLDVKAMEQSGNYRAVYQQDRVWVFEVKQ